MHAPRSPYVTERTGKGEKKKRGGGGGEKGKEEVSPDSAYRPSALRSAYYRQKKKARKRGKKRGKKEKKKRKNGTPVRSLFIFFFSLFILFEP